MVDAVSGMLQIDVSNAFNILLTETSAIKSTNGVQQGDSLSPFLLSVGIHQVITRLKRKFGGTLQIWYLDDGVIAGKLSVLELLIQELAVEFGNIGLNFKDLNKQKCRLLTKGVVTPYQTLATISFAAAREAWSKGTGPYSPNYGTLRRQLATAQKWRSRWTDAHAQLTFFSTLARKGHLCNRRRHCPPARPVGPRTTCQGRLRSRCRYGPYKTR